MDGTFSISSFSPGISISDRGGGSRAARRLERGWYSAYTSSYFRDTTPYEYEYRSMYTYTYEYIQVYRTSIRTVP